MSIIWNNRKQAVNEAAQLVKAGMPFDVAAMQVIPKYTSSKSVQPTPTQMSTFKKQVLECACDITDEKRKLYALLSNVQYAILRNIEENEMVNISDVGYRSLVALAKKEFIEVNDYIVFLTESGKEILSAMCGREVLS